MSKVKVGIVALLMGLAGVGLGLAAIHAWEDHRVLHVLIQLEAQRQQAATK